METLEAAASVMRKTLFEIGGTPVSGATLVAALGIVLITILVSRLAQAGMRRWLLRRGVSDEGSIVVTGRLLHYIIVFVGFGIAVHTMGINLSALFAAGAIFAIGLGFAMQTIAQNFVARVILLVERAITPGDVLEVEGTVVKVLRMGIRSTVVRSRDGEDVIVPNSVLVQSIVKNYTLDDGAYRVRTRVGVTYGSDLKLVREVLEDVANRIRTDLPNTRPQVLLLEFGNHSVDFEVSIWMDATPAIRAQPGDLVGFQGAGDRDRLPTARSSFGPSRSGQPSEACHNGELARWLALSHQVPRGISGSSTRRRRLQLLTRPSRAHLCRSYTL